MATKRIFNYSQWYSRIFRSVIIIHENAQTPSFSKHSLFSDLVIYTKSKTLLDYSLQEFPERDRSIDWK